VVGVVSLIVSFFLLVIVHEAGHLLAGLWSGYRFVSFRVLNFTFVREGGRIRVKRYGIAGTGGQCLLAPPDLPLEQIPVGWYNAGGVVANLAVLLVALPLLWLDLNPFLREFIEIFLLADVIMILVNGIPLKGLFSANDASNLLAVKRSLECKEALVMQLRGNAMIQEGIRLKDMPDVWFRWPATVDYSNPLEVSVPLLYASRLLDMERWDEAYGCFDSLYSHRDELMPLYVKEIACELAFAAMATGRADRARELLTPDLMKYIGAYSGVMSSKKRLLWAKALYLDGDKTKADEILTELSGKRDEFLLRGEVDSDIAVMKALAGGM
ncbi:MAG: hypothetical protein K2H14_00815, partial [Muribaculaceae bacterium]|nr:hypothetical protein [Muribaculaceae bacterium]